MSLCTRISCQGVGNLLYIIDTEISSRKKDYVKMIRKMHQPIGNANDENSLVKKPRSSYHKRERRKLTSEQHRIAISIDL